MPLDNSIKEFWQEKLGHMSEDQAEFILSTLKDKSTGNILEIGFAGGRHTYAILKSFDVKKMVTVDIDFDYQNGRRKIDEIRNEFSNIKFVEGDSKKILTEDFINENFPNGLDYVLVDGGHGYGDAFSDMVNVFKHLVKGGLMIVDDYKSKVCPIAAVDQAIEDFARTYKLEYQTVSTKDGKGMAVFIHE